MLTLTDRKKLIEAGRGTRLGAKWPGQRCLAKTRKGHALPEPRRDRSEQVPDAWRPEHRTTDR